MNDLSFEARTLLDISRDADDPTREDRLRVQRRLAAAIGAGIAITSTASTATAGTTKAGVATAGTLKAAGTAGAGKIATWLAVGVAAGLMSAGALVALSHVDSTGPRATSNAGRSVPALASRSIPAAPSVEPNRAPSEIATVPTAEAEQPRIAAPPTSAPHSGTHALTTSSLAAETALLEAARAALGKGDARGALALLDEHEREFPNGTLTEERLASKVFALCDVGRQADARTTAAELLRRAPTSPLRTRVLDSCAFTK